MNKPVLSGAYVAANATVVGEVTLEKDVSVWYGAVLRGDSGDITAVAPQHRAVPDADILLQGNFSHHGGVGGHIGAAEYRLVHTLAPFLVW